MSFIKTFFAGLLLAVPVPIPGTPGTGAPASGRPRTCDPLTGHVPLANPGTPWGALANSENPALGKAPPVMLGTALRYSGEPYLPLTRLLAAKGTNPAIPGPDVSTGVEAGCRTPTLAPIPALTIGAAVVYTSPSALGSGTSQSGTECPITVDCMPAGNSGCTGTTALVPVGAATVPA